MQFDASYSGYALRQSIEAMKSICRSELLSTRGPAAAEFLDELDYESLVRDMAERAEAYSAEKQMRFAEGYPRYLARRLVDLAKKRYRIRQYNEYWNKSENVLRRLNHHSNTAEDVPAELHRGLDLDERDYLVAVLRKTYDRVRELGAEDLSLSPGSKYIVLARETFPQLLDLHNVKSDCISLAKVVEALKDYQISSRSAVSRFGLVQ